MTDAISSFGVLLKVGDGGTPETFASVMNVGDVDGPDLSLDTEEITNHGSANGWDEHVGTILRGGELSTSVNFLPTDATHDMATGLQANMINRTKRNFQLIYPDGGSNGYQFTALVTGWKALAPVKGVLRADLKLKLTGQVIEL